MLVCEYLLNHKPAKIAHFVHTHMERKGQKRFNGVATNDPQYRSIFQRILRVKKAKDQGNLEYVLNFNEGGMDRKARRTRTKDLDSKYVKTNASDQHVLNQYHGVEKLLFEKLEGYWADNKRVLRAVIFRTVLGIDLSFKFSGGVGGKGSMKLPQQIKQWFYFGFKRRRYLSNRKISSVGQKYLCDGSLI